MCTPECTWHSTKGTCRAPFCRVHRCSCVLLRFRTSSIGPGVIFFRGYRLILARFYGLLVSTCSRSTNYPQLKHPSFEPLFYLFLWNQASSFVLCFTNCNILMELHQTLCMGGIMGLTGTMFSCGICRRFSPWGGKAPQAKLLVHLCLALEISEGKTDALECSRQCQIFKTKN